MVFKGFFLVANSLLRSCGEDAQTGGYIIYSDGLHSGPFVASAKGYSLLAYPQATSSILLYSEKVTTTMEGSQWIFWGSMRRHDPRL